MCPTRIVRSSIKDQKDVINSARLASLGRNRGEQSDRKGYPGNGTGSADLPQKASSCVQTACKPTATREIYVVLLVVDI
ncbi:hypothetical protein MRX96_009547 [Rhipicephalus microplus]